MSNETDSCCQICKISFTSSSELEEHLWSLMHHVKLEKKEKCSEHTCCLCQTTTINLVEYGRHLNELKHKQALGKARCKKAEPKICPPPPSPLLPPPLPLQVPTNSFQSKPRQFLQTKPRQFLQPNPYWHLNTPFSPLRSHVNYFKGYRDIPPLMGNMIPHPGRRAWCMKDSLQLEESENKNFTALPIVNKYLFDFTQDFDYNNMVNTGDIKTNSSNLVGPGIANQNPQEDSNMSIGLPNLKRKQNDKLKPTKKRKRKKLKPQKGKDTSAAAPIKINPKGTVKGKGSNVPKPFAKTEVGKKFSKNIPNKSKKKMIITTRSGFIQGLFQVDDFKKVNFDAVKLNLIDATNENGVKIFPTKVRSTAPKGRIGNLQQPVASSATQLTSKDQGVPLRGSKLLDDPKNVPSLSKMNEDVAHKGKNETVRKQIESNLPPTFGITDARSSSEPSSQLSNVTDSVCQVPKNSALLNEVINRIKIDHKHTKSVEPKKTSVSVNSQATKPGTSLGEAGRDKTALKRNLNYEDTEKSLSSVNPGKKQKCLMKQDVADFSDKNLKLNMELVSKLRKKLINRFPDSETTSNSQENTNPSEEQNQGKPETTVGKQLATNVGKEGLVKMTKLSRLSRKEQMHLSSVLKSYTKSQNKKLAVPRLTMQLSGLYDSGNQELSKEDLPVGMEEQIVQLIKQETLEELNVDGSSNKQEKVTPSASSSIPGVETKSPVTLKKTASKSKISAADKQQVLKPSSSSFQSSSNSSVCELSSSMQNQANSNTGTGENQAVKNSNTISVSSDLQSPIAPSCGSAVTTQSRSSLNESNCMSDSQTIGTNSKTTDTAVCNGTTGSVQDESVFNRIYTLTLREEEICSNVISLDDKIGYLEKLIEDSQIALQGCKKERVNLAAEEKSIRKKRMTILKEAVGDKNSDNSNIVNQLQHSNASVQQLTELKRTLSTASKSQGHLQQPPSTTQQDLQTDQKVPLCTLLTQRKESQPVTQIPRKGPQSAMQAQQKGSHSVPLIQKNGPQSATLIQKKGPQSAKLIHKKISQSAILIQKKGPQSATLIQKKGPQSATLVQKKGPQSATLIQKKGPQSATLIQKKGPQSATLIKKKCPQSATLIEKQGPQSATLIQKKGPQSATLIQKKGPQSATLIQKKGPQSATLIQKKSLLSATLIQKKGALLATLIQKKGPQSATLIQKKGPQLATLIQKKGSQLATLIQKKDPQSATGTQEKDPQSATLTQQNGRQSQQMSNTIESSLQPSSSSQEKDQQQKSNWSNNTGTTTTTIISEATANSSKSSKSIPFPLRSRMPLKPFSHTAATCATTSTSAASDAISATSAASDATSSKQQQPVETSMETGPSLPAAVANSTAGNGQLKNCNSEIKKLLKQAPLQTTSSLSLSSVGVSSCDRSTNDPYDLSWFQSRTQPIDAAVMPNTQNTLLPVTGFENIQIKQEPLSPPPPTESTEAIEYLLNHIPIKQEPLSPPHSFEPNLCQADQMEQQQKETSMEIKPDNLQLPGIVTNPLITSSQQQQNTDYQLNKFQEPKAVPPLPTPFSSSCSTSASSHGGISCDSNLNIKIEPTAVVNLLQTQSVAGFEHIRIKEEPLSPTPVSEQTIAVDFQQGPFSQSAETETQLTNQHANIRDPPPLIQDADSDVGMENDINFCSPPSMRNLLDSSRIESFADSSDSEKSSSGMSMTYLGSMSNNFLEQLTESWKKQNVTMNKRFWPGHLQSLSDSESVDSSNSASNSRVENQNKLFVPAKLNPRVCIEPLKYPRKRTLSEPVSRGSNTNSKCLHSEVKSSNNKSESFVNEKIDKRHCNNKDDVNRLTGENSDSVTDNIVTDNITNDSSIIVITNGDISPTKSDSSLQIVDSETDLDCEVIDIDNRILDKSTDGSLNANITQRKEMEISTNVNSVLTESNDIQNEQEMYRNNIPIQQDFIDNQKSDVVQANPDVNDNENFSLEGRGSSLVYKGPKKPVTGCYIFENCLYASYQGHWPHKFDLDTGVCLKIYDCEPYSVQCMLVCRINRNYTKLFSGGASEVLLEFNELSGKLLSHIDVYNKIYTMHEKWESLFVGLANGGVSRINLKSMKEISNISYGTKPIHCLATCTEGALRLLCVGAYDASILIVDASTGLLLKTLSSKQRLLYSIRVLHNLIYSCSDDRTLAVHDITSGELVKCIRAHSGTISCLHVDENILVSGSHDKLLNLYKCPIINPDVERPVSFYGAGKECVSCLAVNNRIIYSGNFFGVIEAVSFCPTDKKWYCKYDSCVLVFGLQEHLKYHVTSEHIGGTNRYSKRLRCRWEGCGESFQSLSNLRQHCVIHLN